MSRAQNASLMVLSVATKRVGGTDTWSVIKRRWNNYSAAWVFHAEPLEKDLKRVNTVFVVHFFTIEGWVKYASHFHVFATTAQ